MEANPDLCGIDLLGGSRARISEFTDNITICIQPLGQERGTRGNYQYFTESLMLDNKTLYNII